jgi:hypothetical protein
VSGEDQIGELLDGYDRDVALAILSQARLRSSLIDEIQVLQLIRMGCNAGYRKRYGGVRALPINGCRYCGAEQREHAQRWVEGVGWHGYTTPSDELRKARLKFNKLHGYN